MRNQLSGNYAVELGRQELPAWARAENMEQCISQEQLWGISDRVVGANKKHPIRARIAITLYSLANKVCDRKEYMKLAKDYARA